MKSIFLSSFLLLQINAWGFIKSKVALHQDHGFGESLNRETKLILGQFLMSENGRFKVEIDDGNLVLLDDGNECWSSNVPHHALGWQVETEFKFQDDGNLIVQRKIDDQWNVIWASATNDRPDKPNHAAAISSVHEHSKQPARLPEGSHYTRSSGSCCLDKADELREERK